jgi:DNA-directed RNA polymerase subunit beta
MVGRVRDGGGDPCTQTVQGRKVSCLGPGGLTGELQVFRAEIHLSHCRRICPIDTSEGIGLAESLAIHVRIDHWWGFIESVL